MASRYSGGSDGKWVALCVCGVQGDRGAEHCQAHRRGWQGQGRGESWGTLEGLRHDTGHLTQLCRCCCCCCRQPQPRPSGVSAPPEAVGEGGAGAGTPGIATTAAPLSPTQAQQGVVGEKGEGVKKNLQKALKYFSLSGKQRTAAYPRTSTGMEGLWSAKGRVLCVCVRCCYELGGPWDR